LSIIAEEMSGALLRKRSLHDSCDIDIKVFKVLNAFICFTILHFLFILPTFFNFKNVVKVE